MDMKMTKSHTAKASIVDVIGLTFSDGLGAQQTGQDSDDIQWLGHDIMFAKTRGFDDGDRKFASRASS